MEEQKKDKISATDAARKLLEHDGNGKYVIGDLEGTAERKNLTQIVQILNQVDLSKADESGFGNLRKALGMIGAHDKYGYIGPEGQISSLSEFASKSANGDLQPARMYVNKFFGSMDEFSRSQIDDKFTDIMAQWVGKSNEMIQRNGVSINDLTQNALGTSKIRIGDTDKGIEDTNKGKIITTDELDYD